MLEEISIKNLILIKSLTLHLKRGFTSVTGETGAGKSIFLTALGLLCGQRASAELIREGEDKAQISGTFIIPPQHQARTILAEHDIDIEGDEPLIIRRTFSRQGRSQIWIADQGISLALLKRITTTLIEIQGQHTQLELADIASHRQYLDDFGVPRDLIQKTQACYEAWQAQEEKYRHQKDDFEKSKQEEDYLRHSDEELSKLAIGENEEDELAVKRATLKRREKESEAASQAYTILTAQSQPNSSALSIVSDAQRRLETSTIEIEEGDPVHAILDLLSNAQDSISEAETQLDQFLTHHIPSTEELDTIEERLFKIREIARKYDIRSEEIPQYHQKIKEQIQLLENAQQNFEHLQKNVKRTYQAYIEQATILHKRRVKAADEMEKAITKELSPLGLGKAHFEVNLQKKDEDNFSGNGIDKIKFLIATNPGQKATDLSKTISGGELSRIALAMRVISRDVKLSKILIFDEIDTGLGGATAGAIGERLYQLGKTHQVIAVTHNPQVAALAVTQIRLQKRMTDHETMTHATILDKDQRIEEIARMLSANKITKEARAAAQSLLKSHK